MDPSWENSDCTMDTPRRLVWSELWRFRARFCRRTFLAATLAGEPSVEVVPETSTGGGRSPGVGRWWFEGFAKGFHTSPENYKILKPQKIGEYWVWVDVSSLFPVLFFFLRFQPLVSGGVT